MQGQVRWVRLGWQGVALEVPEDWCPGSIEGDYANGYLRVEDETHVRLELRWETAARGVPAASRLVDAYLKQSLRKLPRGSPEPAIDRDRTIKELAAVDHEAFTWRGAPRQVQGAPGAPRGGYNAHSLLLVVPEARRAVHLRVFFDAADDMKALARRLFGSVRVAAGDAPLEWAVFGLRFLLPAAWRLEQSALRTGVLKFVFRAGNDELEVMRQSLAGITLKGTSLEAWLLAQFAKALRGFRWSSRSESYRGHGAARCGGPLSLRARPLALFRRRRYASALAWHCPQADKLFALRCESFQADDPRLAACADSIACCAGAESPGNPGEDEEEGRG